jgi:hypothetical protein
VIHGACGLGGEEPSATVPRERQPLLRWKVLDPWGECNAQQMQNAQENVRIAMRVRQMEVTLDYFADQSQGIRAHLPDTQW